MTIIPSQGAPPPALLEPPTDIGWRWSPPLYSWVSPAFDVSWANGAVIPSFSSPYAGQHVRLYVGDWTVTSAGRSVPALADLSQTSAAFGTIESYGSFLPSGDKTASADGAGVAFVVQAQGIPASDVANYVPNPSFEVTYEPWAHGSGSATLDNSSSDAQSGTKAAEVNCNALGTTVFIDFPIPADSATYTASLYFRSQAGGVTSTLQVAYWVGDTLGSFTGQAVTQTAGARTSLTTTAPAGAQAARLRISISGGSGASPYVFDAVAFTPGTTSYPYFDGDTAYDGVYDYEWVHEPSQSPSVRRLHVTTDIPADRDTPLAPSLDVLAMLGPDVAASSTFTYPPEDVDSPGDDGDYWLDATGRALYGPKAGVWPADPAVSSFKLTQLVR